MVLDRGSPAARDERGADRQVAIRGGRLVGLADVGDPHGAPVVFFPGGGDSRLTRHPDDSIAVGLGIRLLVVERPGCGLSDWTRRGDLADWAQDVDALADALALERFAVMGWSAGGPHALAVAAALPGRVERAVVVAGMPLPEWSDVLSRDLRAVLRLSRRAPVLARQPLARWGKRPVPPTGGDDWDRAYTAGRVESFRNGSRWLAAELGVLARPWGIDVAAIERPVTLWYGERDRVCPVEIGRRFAERIPGAELVVTDDGHQLIFPRWRELLQLTLGGAAPRAPA